jgi:hypothetical protein
MVKIDIEYAEYKEEKLMKCHLSFISEPHERKKY